MITYSKQLGGIHLLLRPYGSPLPRATPLGLCSTALYFILYYCVPMTYWKEQLMNPYIVNGFLLIIGIVIAFRANHSYERYWEGRTEMQSMTTMLLGVASSAMAHEAVSIDGERIDQDGVNEATGRAQWTVADKARMKSFCDEISHLITLLNALFLMHLRCDWKLANIIEYDHNSSPPPEDAAGIKGHKITLKDIFFIRDDAEVRKKYHALCPLPVIGAMTIHERFALGEQNEEMAIAVTETLFSGQSIASRAWAEQQKLLQELEDAELHPVDEENNANKTEFPGVAISPDGTRLNPILSKKMDPEPAYEGKFAFLRPRLGYDVPGATERVYTAHGWLLGLIARKTHPKYGWTGALPPTTAQLAMVSNTALIQFEQCNKITTCPFPFPYAQVIIYLLMVITFILPICVLPVTPSLWVGAVVVHFTVTSFWAVNEVSRDIESPFGMDPNDLSISHMQWSLCKAVQSSAEAILADGSGKCPHRCDKDSNKYAFYKGGGR